ncbi:MAG: YvcK family protein [bacterium]|nr:YvcK family protein [bacterium]
MKNYLKNWWKWLRYEPNDPRFETGKTIKIAVIGGGTGLANMLRGLKKYSNKISAIVTVSDDGASSGEIRKEFDILPPGDVRKCISALAYNEKLITEIFEYRFAEDKKNLGGHTLGNIWITALSDYFGSFEKAVEITSEIFQTAGTVLPATLDDARLKIEYEDGSIQLGEHYLDEVLTRIKKVSFDKKVHGYKKVINAIRDADLVVVGPGSLYGSLIPNLIITEIKDAIALNSKAVRVLIANCSTERTQTRNYSIDDHISAIFDHTKTRLFDYCLVNSRVIKKSKNETKLGEINNITTKKNNISGVKIIRANVINNQNPLYHDSEKLAKSIIGLYNKAKQR